MSAPGIYRAKVVAPFSSGSCSVVVPQLFGDVQVLITRFVGTDLPLNLTMGWVMFEGGNEDQPVWMDADTALTSDEWFVNQAEADATKMRVLGVISALATALNVTDPVFLAALAAAAL